MGNFRELIGRDLHDDLETDYHETPLDRIGAFSKGGRLGTLLWRLKYGKDLTCFKPAALLLAKDTSMESPIGRRVCELAISEWLLPECDTCRGAKEMIVGPKRIVCPSCEGYGVRRYSDSERDRILRRGETPEEIRRWRNVRFKPWTKKFAAICEELTKSARAINPKMNTELER